MGVRLRLLHWWTPNYVVKRELRNLSDKTNEALKSLLTNYEAKGPAIYEIQQLYGSIAEQRTKMAQTHAEMVEALIAAVGHEKAVALGRDALFSVGVELGKQTRRKLGVNDKAQDIIMAAKILYRVLGIDFHLEWPDNSHAVAIIDHCALAERYSQLTCQILSATDEGVIKGLQPNVTMQFKEYLTSGCKNCKADICFNGKEIVA